MDGDDGGKEGPAGWRDLCVIQLSLSLTTLPSACRLTLLSNEHMVFRRAVVSQQSVTSHTHGRSPLGSTLRLFHRMVLQSTS